MPNARFYSSIAAVTNLQVTANPGDVSFQVASSSGWPGSFPFIVSLDYGAANEELVLVTSGGPNIFQATRAYDGTSSSTHNAGAVVRHVSSAIDFTDSRTHEASTTGVHGISGAFVDTNSVQTLSNKTLTSPTINNPTIGGTASGGTYTGATLTSPTINTPTITTPSISNPTITGTVAGTPTHSGLTAFTAGINVSGAPVNVTRALSTNSAFNAQVTGDTNARFSVAVDGTHTWGSGSAVADTTLQRTGVGFLGLTGSFTTSGSVTATGNLLGNDISLTTTTWTTYTPTFVITGSPATSVNVGWYKKFGKIVFWEVHASWTASGSGTNQITFSLPSTPFRDGAGPNTTRQSAGDGWIANTGGPQSQGDIRAQVAAGGTGATSVLSFYDTTPLQSQSIQNGTILTLQGWYREA